MSLANLPRGYDAWKLRGPDERDIEADQDKENAEIDLAYERARDDAMREDEADMRREQERARHDELMHQARRMR